LLIKMTISVEQASSLLVYQRKKDRQDAYPTG
jgi:hypothetical protein